MPAEHEHNGENMVDLVMRLIEDLERGPAGHRVDYARERLALASSGVRWIVDQGDTPSSELLESCRECIASHRAATAAFADEVHRLTQRLNQGWRPT